MAYTTFPNEVLVYRHPNGETLVLADTSTGRAFVAITKDGYRTDYPYLRTSGGGTVAQWDNPEWFTKSFREKVLLAILGRLPRTLHAVRSHREHAARIRPAVPCNSNHTALGGGCFNCLWPGPLVPHVPGCTCNAHGCASNGNHSQFCSLVQKENNG